MGSHASNETIQQLEKDAYSALLRAVYIRPTVDVLSAEELLSKARIMLNISNEVGADLFQGVKTDIELIRRGQRPVGTKFAAADSLPPGPIGAPGSSRPRSRPVGGGGGGGGGGGARPPPSAPGSAGGIGTRQPSLARPRSTRSMGAIDPHNLVFRRIWRFYPNEDPEKPWVEGFIVDYDAITGTYNILYDPNDPTKQESVEHGFNIDLANPSEYVLGDYFEVDSLNGSRRQAQRPAAVPIAAPAAAAATPAKRRRSSAKIPATVPYAQSWFETTLLEATSDDLHTMLNALQSREDTLVLQIANLEMALTLGDDLDKRISLENEFEELCRKETRIMAELQALRGVEQ